MHNMVPFVQFKNSRGGMLLSVKLQVLVCNLTKVTLIHGWFSSFLNCTIDTKSRKASLEKIFAKKLFLTHFMLTLLFCAPWKHETKGFQGVFSGSTERRHWPEISLAVFPLPGLDFPSYNTFSMSTINIIRKCPRSLYCYFYY